MSMYSDKISVLHCSGVEWQGRDVTDLCAKYRATIRYS